MNTLVRMLGKDQTACDVFSQLHKSYRMEGINNNDCPQKLTISQFKIMRRTRGKTKQIKTFK